jgi:poly(3-hydroxybutyrate) depolymerase
VPIAAPFHLMITSITSSNSSARWVPDVHLISVCQPTVPVLAAVSLMASQRDQKLPGSR